MAKKCLYHSTFWRIDGCGHRIIHEPRFGGQSLEHSINDRQCWREEVLGVRMLIVLRPSGNATIGGPLIVTGQLDWPYPQYTDLNVAGFGCCGSTYNSLQVSATRRFSGGGTLLVAYTNAKLLTNTDTLTSWLENGTTGGVGQVQDWNNLNGECSLSSQDVSQRLVVSYVLDLRFGHGRRYLSNVSGVTSKVVSGSQSLLAVRIERAIATVRISSRLFVNHGRIIRLR